MLCCKRKEKIISIEERVDISLYIFKGNAQFIFLCNPQKSFVIFFLKKNNKKYCHKKSSCVFLWLSWRKFFKIAASAIFPTSIMALFEIHQRFKGDVLNEFAFPLKNFCGLFFLSIFIKWLRRIYLVNISIERVYIWFVFLA